MVRAMIHSTESMQLYPNGGVLRGCYEACWSCLSTITAEICHFHPSKMSSHSSIIILSIKTISSLLLQDHRSGSVHSKTSANGSFGLQQAENASFHLSYLYKRGASSQDIHRPELPHSGWWIFSFTTIYKRTTTSPIVTERVSYFSLLLQVQCRIC